MSDDDVAVAGPLDVDILDRIGHRLTGSGRFSAVNVQPESAPDSVVAEFDLGYYPAAVEQAYLQIRWFRTDDFSVHYYEEYASGGTWECRWDRHPNDHNTRAHFHPPPDAPTDGADAEYPTDWRDVLTQVLERLDKRIRSFWE
jgi:hypothetical protein